MEPAESYVYGADADGGCAECELHPVYGALPVDGEIVRVGDLLGLSLDSTEVVVAPATGRVRLIPSMGGTERRLRVQIWPVEPDASVMHQRPQ